jgi:hypothetical protein
LGQALNGAVLADYRFMLVGHTGAKVDEPYNQALSERRADAVKDFLVRTLGIAPERRHHLLFGLRAPFEKITKENQRSRQIAILAATCTAMWRTGALSRPCPT